MIQIGVQNSITQANTLFGNPVPQGAYKITFEEHTHLVTNVQCNNYINFSSTVSCNDGSLHQRILKIDDYAKNLLPDTIPYYNSALQLNQPDLSNGDLCTKQIAEKTKTVLETHKQSLVDQINRCLDYIDSLPCPGIFQ